MIRKMAPIVTVVCAIVFGARWPLIAQRPQPPEIAKGPNVLFGHVLDAGTRAPVGGAQVTLFAYLGPAGPPPANAFSTFGQASGATPVSSAPRGVVAGADGEFWFGDLPAGRYAVAASAFGYLNGSYFAPTTLSPMHLVDIVDHERPMPVSVRLIKGASISGTVVDDRGDPIVDAPVEAFTRSAAELRQVVVDVRTDDRGAYRIAQLPPGTYVVGVVTSARTIAAGLGAAMDASASDPVALGKVFTQLIPTLEYGPGQERNGEGTRVGNWILQRKGPIAPPAPDGRMLAYATTLYPATAVPSEATPIALGSGDQRSGIDMALHLVPTVTVSGVLIGPDGPLQNASVRLNATHAGDERDVSETGECTTITNASGAFTFLGVPQGQYVMTSSYLPVEADAGKSVMTLWARQLVAAGDRDVSGLTLTMRPGIRVAGRIDPPNGPARVRVSLSPVAAMWQRTLPFDAAPDGHFAGGGTPPGRYLINVGAAGSSSVIAIMLSGRPLIDHTLVLESSDVSDLVITMSNTPLHLTGSVLDTNGAAASQANVFAFPADTTTWRQGVLSFHRRCVTAATTSGSFDCAGLTTGEYYVAAIDPQTLLPTDLFVASDPAFLDRLIAGATRVTLTASGAAPVSLKLFTPKEH